MPRPWRACRRTCRSPCAPRQQSRSLPCPYLLVVSGGSGRPLLHIASGGGLDRRVGGAAGCARRRAAAALERFEPARPFGPPASRLFTRLREPRIGVCRIGIPGPVAALSLRCRIDHARDVAARAEHEGLLATQQPERAVRRAPRDDVILASREDERRPLDLAEI